THLAVAARNAFQVVRGGVKVLARLRLVELGEEIARLILVARVAAERMQRVGREGDEIGRGQPPRDIFDVWVEATVLVDDENDGQVAPRRRGAAGRRRARRPHQIAAPGPVTSRRGETDGFSLDARIGPRNLLSLGELRAQGFEQPGRGDATDRELRGGIEKAAPVDGAVHVLVEEAQDLRSEIGGGLAPARGVDHDLFLTMRILGCTATRRPRRAKCLAPGLASISFGASSAPKAWWARRRDGEQR